MWEKVRKRLLALGWKPGSPHGSLHGPNNAAGVTREMIEDDGLRAELILSLKRQLGGLERRVPINDPAWADRLKTEFTQLLEAAQDAEDA